MRPIHLATLAAVLALAGGPAVAGSDTGDAEEYVPEAETSELHQAPLAGVEGKEVVVKEFTLPPGHEGKAHKHSGPVFVYVIEGELTVETDEGDHTFAAGDLYPEPLDVTMRARNVSADSPTKIVVFQINDAGEVMMKKAE
ncbi:MAG TPA: cupin domain-containing protein [Thermohalobaculum sp.]|nr:cupin domain-containing protein [Thermohalobaculum sp.]